jgi:hypothetical protein
MKIKVADSVKGKLSIIGLSKTLLAGQEVDLTKDQFSSHQVQSLLKSGILQSSNYKPTNNIQFKNNSRNKIRMPWGQFVGPNQVFDVEINNSVTVQFVNLVNEGLVSEFKKQDEKEEVVVVKEKKNKSVNKAPKDMNKVVSSQKVPKDTYIHDPKIKTKNSIKNKIEEIDKDLEEGVFVDKKQTRERLLRMQKNLRNQQG